MGLESCEGLVGASNLACLAAEASYVPVILALAVLFGILYFRMNFEPARNRFAASLLIVSMVSLLLSVAGFLPDGVWGVTVFLAVGAAALMVVR